MPYVFSESASSFTISDSVKLSESLRIKLMRKISTAGIHNLTRITENNSKRTPYGVLFASLSITLSKS